MRLHQLVTLDTQAGRFLVVGDVHGQFDCLLRLLGHLEYDPHRDKLLFVGDLIDRGPDSLACLEMLDSPAVYACLGNHEQMALDSMADSSGLMQEFWSANGGRWFDKLTHEQQQSVQYLIVRHMSYSLEFIWKGYRIGLVHAEFPAELSWQDIQSSGKPSKTQLNQMLWSRNRIRGHIRGKIPGVDLLVVGHTMLEDAHLEDNVFYLDTGAASMQRDSALSSPRLSVLVFDDQVRLYGIDRQKNISQYPQPLNDFLKACGGKSKVTIV
ncbi:metallophosphoesterase [Bowmanella dokdonensis]|uniref:Metallophosphoesterase n=1 Tax=Bowmanella dokdonensis TaxID=751969 RepID=A0A939IQU0_9ALTE|nr:metallophosphoesterase [Bowmanella dokdonensis]MBN7825419.1 metallophosphoesterase [Bowmanella dokdonensis]